MKRILILLAAALLTAPALSQEITSLHWTVKNNYPRRPFAKYEFELRADGHYSGRVTNFKGKSKSKQGVLAHPDSLFARVRSLHLENFHKPVGQSSHQSTYLLEETQKSAPLLSLKFGGELSPQAKELVDLMDSELPGQLCRQLGGK